MQKVAHCRTSRTGGRSNSPRRVSRLARLMFPILLRKLFSFSPGKPCFVRTGNVAKHSKKPGWSLPAKISAVVPITVVTACTPTPRDNSLCTSYPAQHESAYILPFEPGNGYRVSQGNCSRPGDGHRGSEKYAYDFAMPVGTPFVAMRSGGVVHVQISHRD